MTAGGWPSRIIEVELQGPDPGWIETLFYHLRTLMVRLITKMPLLVQSKAEEEETQA